LRRHRAPIDLACYARFPPSTEFKTDAPARNLQMENFQDPAAGLGEVRRAVPSAGAALS